MFLQNLDDTKYDYGRKQALSELELATMNGETEVKVSNLRLSNLPITVVQ